MKPVQNKTYFEKDIDENNEVKISIEVNGYSINATRALLAEIVDRINETIRELSKEQ